MGDPRLKLVRKRNARQTKGPHVALGLSFEAHMLLAGSLLRHLVPQHRHVLIEQALAVKTPDRNKKAQNEINTKKRLAAEDEH